MIARNVSIRIIATGLLTSALMVLAGCATYGNNGYGNNGYSSAPRSVRCGDCGTVQSVRQVYVAKDHSTLGTVIGAVVGGALGNQVGKGDGRKAATVAGAVAGGAVGHHVGGNSGSQKLAYEVTVRMEDGRLATVTQEEDPRVRSGDYVEVRGDHVYLR